MPEKNTERKIHLRFSEDLHWRLRIRCVPLDTTIQHFVVEQLERELSASVSGRRGPAASTHAKPSTRSRNVARKGDDRACFHFVSDLDEVAAKIAKLTNTDPARAVALYETFLAGCHEKAEEVNDSSGSLGQFVDELFCGWIKVRQAACADPDETATRLLGWMDDDPYGFCCHLEKDAVKVFDKAGRAAFAKLFRAHFEGAARTKPTADGSFKDRREYICRRWGEALPMLYLAQENIEAYVALAEETGIVAQNCHAIAMLLVTRRKPEEALAWVERGISLDKKTPHAAGSLEATRGITLRASRRRDLVPGQIVVVKPRKQLSYAGHPYLSGEIESVRLDVAALGLVPLRLEGQGTWTPDEHSWGEEDEPIDEWAKPIIARGPRQAFEMDQVVPGKDAGDHRPEDAIRHYEVGLRIGELSLGPAFDGLLPWGHIDSQSARFRLDQVRSKTAWEDRRKER